MTEKFPDRLRAPAYLLIYVRNLVANVSSGPAGGSRSRLLLIVTGCKRKCSSHTEEKTTP